MKRANAVWEPRRTTQATRPVLSPTGKVGMSFCEVFQAFTLEFLIQVFQTDADHLHHGEDERTEGQGAYVETETGEQGLAW